jgi:hypothetical protein
MAVNKWIKNNEEYKKGICSVTNYVIYKNYRPLKCDAM